MEPSEQEEDDNFSSESEAEAEDAMNPPPAMQLPPEQVHNLYHIQNLGGGGGGGGATILKYIKVYPRVKIGKKPTF